MDLDEKLAQLGSCWFFELQTGGELDDQKTAGRLAHGIGQITRVGGASTLEPAAIARAGNRIQRFLMERTRLGIPAILHEECCCGAMVLGGTVYPQMLGLGSTFQPELACEMAEAIRQQLLAIGGRLALGPVLDLALDARWGRVEETFGEDPTLVSQFGVAYIRGLQGERLSRGVAATAKHFIGHSLSQGGLNCGPVHLGWAELGDVYLAPFEAAIRQARVAAVMNAYPEIDGEVVAASRRILTDLLRERLGFEGPVVSDYESVAMVHNFHNAADNEAQAASRALRAGIDVELPTQTCFGAPLRAALESGAVSLEDIDLAVRRHLQLKSDLGLFDNPYVGEDNVEEVFETPSNRELARRLARQSMVLLKNDGLLPLSRAGRRLGVIGPNADDGRSQLGDYAYIASAELQTLLAPPDSSFAGLDLKGLAARDIRIRTVLEGMRAIGGEAIIQHARGCGLQSGTPQELEEAVRLAEESDVVILVLGERSGLTPGCTTGETRDSADLRLPPAQETLARAVLATGTPVVAVLINGRPLALPWLEAQANAILEAWLPGEEGGPAVAEILFGDACPGGKLPITVPRSVGQVPMTYRHKPSGNHSHWYGDYVAETVAPLYPFGHGLSYATFAYQRLTLKPAQARVGESVHVSLDVENTSAIAGEEVVQLYVRDEHASSPRPVKQLVAFTRLRLEPGQHRQVTFHLPIDQLAYCGPDLQPVVEPGRFLIMVGSSSEDIRLRGAFDVLGDGPVRIARRVFECPVELGL
jgi:beta-glucosidase